MVKAIDSTAAEGRWADKGLRRERLPLCWSHQENPRPRDFRSRTIAIEVTSVGSATFALPGFGQSYPSRRRLTGDLA
jgi:hypothetical protein